MSHEMVHSLVDTIRNVASLTRLDFFVIFQDRDKLNRRFAGTNEFLELFMRYDLLPHHNDIRLDPAADDNAALRRETLIGDLIPLDTDSVDDKIQDFEDGFGTDDEEGDEEEAREEEEEEEEEEAAVEGEVALPRITNTFSVVPVVCTSTRSGRRSIKPSSRYSSSPSPTPTSVNLVVEEPPRRSAAASRSKNTTRRNEGVSTLAIAIAKPKKKTKMKSRKKGGDRFGERKKEPMSPCDTCGKVFFSRFNMLRHVENVHLRICPYVCKICDRGFPQKNSMQKHIKKVHSKKAKSALRSREPSVEPDGLHAVYQMSEDQFDGD